MYDQYNGRGGSGDCESLGYCWVTDRMHVVKKPIWRM